MGALYSQDPDGALRLCNLEVTPLREIVQQLNDNWLIVFSPNVLTAPITCPNGTSSQFFIQKGVSKHFLSPGCMARFEDHDVVSEDVLAMGAAIAHIQTNWDALDILRLQHTDWEDSYQDLRTAGVANPTFTDVQQSRMSRGRRRRLLLLITLVAVFAGIAIAVLGLLGVLSFSAIKQRTRLFADSVWRAAEGKAYRSTRRVRARLRGFRGRFRPPSGSREVYDEPREHVPMAHIYPNVPQMTSDEDTAPPIQPRERGPI
jgi:hypothetical protein